MIPNDHTRIGIVGAGAWAAEVLACLQQMRRVRVTGIYNRTVPKATQLAERFGVDQVFERLEALCAAPDVDAVMVLARISAPGADDSRITWLIDHMGRPRHDMCAPDFRPVLELANFERIYVKVSGFYGFTQDTAEYPCRDLHRFVIALRDAYGSRRLRWGSDVPPVLDFSSYTQTFRCLHHVPGLTSCDLEWILGRTAEELFHAA